MRASAPLRAWPSGPADRAWPGAGARAFPRRSAGASPVLGAPQPPPSEASRAEDLPQEGHLFPELLQTLLHHGKVLASTALKVRPGSGQALLVREERQECVLKVWLQLPELGHRPDHAGHALRARLGCVPSGQGDQGPDECAQLRRLPLVDRHSPQRLRCEACAEVCPPLCLQELPSPSGKGPEHLPVFERLQGAGVQSGLLHGQPVH
mmetsp:Transcript_45979/g.144035  ORF Transcript_45979/g.144035 Transcript_45979/m.144035 type:complete len:208 (+) Transcript_45979:102-725(+)